jgi:tetratricopeptide (TPR) repeat protein
VKQSLVQVEVKPVDTAETSSPQDRKLGELQALHGGYAGTHASARVNAGRAMQKGLLRASAPVDPVTFGQAANAEGQPAKTGEEMFPALRPQRIDLPSYLNTTARRPNADALPPAPKEVVEATKRIRDLEVLTFACRRAGKYREEGRAYFSLAVHHDNLQQYDKAVRCYAAFLKVCKECNDTQGTSLAYHCLGVDYHFLAEKKGGEEPDKKLMQKALYFHEQQRNSADTVGKFVAHLNMGICYAALGDQDASTVNHQYALRFALQLHSVEGQTMALGNLGLGARIDGERTRVLVEQYVELCESMQQKNALTGALHRLGAIASRQGEFDKAEGYFKGAIDLAKSQGNRLAEKTSRVHCGIAVGSAKMDSHFKELLAKSNADAK